MNSCHEEGVHDRNRGIEAADLTQSAGSAASIPGRFRSRTPSSGHEFIRNWTLLWRLLLVVRVRLLHNHQFHEHFPTLVIPHSLPPLALSLFGGGPNQRVVTSQGGGRVAGVIC
eukprot:gene20905-biopygen7018